MAHITDLHLSILGKVLAYFYHGTMKSYNLQEFKQLLPPAAVCRVWRECMLPYVYDIAYLKYHIKEADKKKRKHLFSRFRGLTRRLNEADADKKNAQPNYEWKSNIDLIVSQRLSSTIGLLLIESSGCSLNFKDMIHALDTFGFSSNHWRSVNLLYISTDHDSVVNDSTPNSNDDETLAAQLTEYFGRHLPNIGNLHIWIDHQSNTNRLLLNKLVNIYVRQLHALHCSHIPITFNCHSFSSRLRHLRVTIASGVINRLPQLLASPLEWLELFNIPHNFAWWTFIGITPGHIEFTNLTYLTLGFQQPSESAEEPNNSSRQVSRSTVSLNIGYRKLFFPKLKKLQILDSPYNDGALYSMFAHSPLQTVIISSSFKSVQHMDTRILFNAADVCFIIHSVSPDDYHDYAEFYCQLLGTPSNAKTARLDMRQSSVTLPIPSTIEWTNLEYLILGANIHLASVIQVITQLPKLHTLGVGNVVDEVDEAGANLQVILRGSLTQIRSIATTVKRLRIYSYLKLPLVFSLDVMRYLTVLIQSLDEVVVPDLYVSDIKEFAVRYANSFPHLHDIKVLCASEENE